MSSDARLARTFGRQAFGHDPANYHAARPPYPDATWETLRARAGLRPGIGILEIGAGTGLATARLLEHGASSIVAIEPDIRLADFLRRAVPDKRLDVRAEPFEAAEFTGASFDLVASATAFHWLDAVPALIRIRGLLRPQGAVALWWNVFGDDLRPDAFHEATTGLLAGEVPSPSRGEPGRPPHALDVEARLRDFAEAGYAADVPEITDWTLTLDPQGVRNLYATYSNVTALPPEDRERLLDGLVEFASKQFGGRVERNMTTIIYTARPG